MNLRTPTSRRIFIFILLAAGLIFIARLPLPQRVHGPCIVEPAVTWQLMQNNAGQVFTAWERNWLGGDDLHQVLANFERPDLIEVKLADDIRDGGRIERGDTVAFIASFETAGLMDMYAAELTKAEAMVTALEAGARTEDIEVARRELSRAEAELGAWRPEYERAHKLYDAGLVSDSVLIQAEGRLRVLEAQREVAVAQVSALEAGGRPEDLEVARQEVKRLMTAIQALRRSESGWKAIVSPIAGRVKLGGVAGEIAQIYRDDTLAVWVRTPEAVLSRLSEAHPIQIRIFAVDGKPRAERVSRLQFQPLGSVNPPPGAYAVVLAANPDRRLKPGMNGRAWLNFPNMTLLDRVRLTLQWW